MSFAFRHQILTALALLTNHALPAQTVAYEGVGGRHEQSRYFIQRNVPLATTGSVHIPASGSNRRIFVRFLTSTTSDAVTGFDIKMKFGILGEVVPAWIYTANAQNEPASPVLSGQIGIGLGLHYCRATFGGSYTVQPNTLYFMAFQLPAGEDLTFATSSSPATNVTYFVTASGAAQQPHIGQTYRVDLSGASQGGPAALWYQLINPGMALDLYPFGSPGSFLYLDLNHILLAAFLPTTPNRQGSVYFYMPNDPSLVGRPVHFQWQLAVTDPGIGAGWVTSNVAHATVL